MFLLLQFVLFKLLVLLLLLVSVLLLLLLLLMLLVSALVLVLLLMLLLLLLVMVVMLVLMMALLLLLLQLSLFMMMLLFNVKRLFQLVLGKRKGEDVEGLQSSILTKNGPKTRLKYEEDEINKKDIFFFLFDFC